jgi:hypothetical protein
MSWSNRDEAVPGGAAWCAAANHRFSAEIDRDQLPAQSEEGIIFLHR